MIHKKLSEMKKLLTYVWRNFRSKLLILAILSVVGGLFEGIGINAFIPLFSTLAGSEAVLPSGKIFTFMQSFFSFTGLPLTLNVLFLFIFFLFLARAVVLFAVEYVRVHLVLGHDEINRRSLYTHYLETNWPYLLKQKLGHFETVVMIDVQQSGAFLTAITKTLTLVVSLLVYVVIVLQISPVVTLATLGAGALIFLIFKPFIRNSRRISFKSAQMKKDIAHAINQTELGIKSVKAMGAESPLSLLARNFFSEFKKILIRLRLFKHVAAVFIQPASLIFVAGVFFIFYRSPNYQFASFLVLLYLIQKIFLFIEQLQGNLHEINGTYPFLRSVLEAEHQIAESREKDQGDKPFSFNKSLSFSHVYFSYYNEKRGQVISDMNFLIQKGEYVALVGTSGSGKTTVVDLILRLFQPQQGGIFLDSTPASSVRLEDWRRHIGYVTQDIFLINGSLADNIRFYNSSVKDEDITRAITMANLEDFVKKQPDGIHTKVGERGVELSGGQRQRVAIARALARQPDLLILDEATSALDMESELEITRVIEKLKGQVTVLAVAHRLSTVMNADRVLVLKNGRLAEQGPPSDLLVNSDSIFYKMYNP